MRTNEHVSQVLLFVEDIVAYNHLYGLWRVCADLRRQLMFVGSHSANSIFFDRDYERLCTLLDYGLDVSACLCRISITVRLNV
jgi:hypothetical protein